MAEYTIDKIQYSGNIYKLEDVNALHLDSHGNLAINGTLAANKGIFNQLIATTASMQNLDVTNLTATNATVVGLLDVQGQLHSNSWTNSNIATIDGSFYITPTVNVAEGTFTYVPTYISGGATVGRIILNAKTGYSFATDDQWTTDSLVMITGQVSGTNAKLPLGTIRGKLSSISYTNNVATTITIIGPFTDSEGNSCATLSNIGAVSGVDGFDLKVSLYQKKLSTGLAPIGIYMTSGGYNTQNKTFIDIYSGGNITSTAPTTAGVSSGAFAKPVLRIGNLKGLPVLQNTAGTLIPDGYGIYTTNGYFEGVLASTQGYIGGFTINSHDLYNGTLGATNSVWMSVGTSGTAAIAGSEFQSGWAFTAGSNFGVTQNGYLYADMGRIGGTDSFISLEKDDYDERHYLNIRLSQLDMLLNGDLYGQDNVVDLLELVNDEAEFLKIWSGDTYWEYELNNQTYSVFLYVDPDTKENVYYYDLNEYSENTYVVSQDTSVITDKEYFVRSVETIANPDGIPLDRGYYELVSGNYILSTDTTVDPNKTYYFVDYDLVEHPTGNPSSIPYYEPIGENWQEYTGNIENLNSKRVYGLSRSFKFTEDSFGNEQALLISSAIAEEDEGNEVASIAVDPQYVGITIQGDDINTFGLGIKYDENNSSGALDIGLGEESIFNINDDNNYMLSTTTGVKFETLGLFRYKGGLAIGIA